MTQNGKNSHKILYRTEVYCCHVTNTVLSGRSFKSIHQHTIKAYKGKIDSENVSIEFFAKLSNVLIVSFFCQDLRIGFTVPYIDKRTRD